MTSPRTPTSTTAADRGRSATAPPHRRSTTYCCRLRLYAKVTGGGIYRMGAWGGKNGTLWPHYDTLTKAIDAASDHCAIYADITLT